MVYFDDEKDDFWDISKLVPKKNPKAVKFSTSERLSVIDIDGDTGEMKKEERKINFQKYENDSATLSRSSRSYKPAWSKLLSKVTIKPSVDRFDFYDTFRKAALIYFDYKCPKCEFVPFYSYMPQYAQMTQEQKKYYFYWRDELRSGRYIKSDYSYIYLYAYEIINLPEKVEKNEALSILCALWRSYRSAMPRLDMFFANFIEDFCLLYELKCPIEYIKDFIFDVIAASSFKEFYIGGTVFSSGGASAMIAYLSDYDWRRGRYAGGENSDVYRMHVEGAMGLIFSKLLDDDIIFESEILKISKPAFRGCLCTHSVKSNLEIEYYSIADSPKMRSGVTAALKYVENKLRACLGVKSRLAVKELPDEFKAIIDGYFELEFRRLKRERERENIPEYERLYDAPEDNATFDGAIEIERASWRMTARLVEGIEDEENDCENIAAAIAPVFKTPSADAAQVTNDGNDKYGLCEDEVSFIKAALMFNEHEMDEIAKRLSKPQSAVAERINEAFADNFGDVILEENESGVFKVLDDYYEEISEWVL